MGKRSFLRWPNFRNKSVTLSYDDILALFSVDKVAEKNALLMVIFEKNTSNPSIWKEYADIMKKYETDNVKIEELERYAFYNRAKNTFEGVQTGESFVCEYHLKEGML